MLYLQVAYVLPTWRSNGNLKKSEKMKPNVRCKDKPVEFTYLIVFYIGSVESRFLCYKHSHNVILCSWI